ncbi:hypothetical protein L1987_20387 [Smallanthus sonchifolius]|uniref:Uncharacterized protein n=1 Tax=Smallanthus sonchifolius TaxID=185202 RepID=A0ACB9IRX6_9ASTR|nr:hypothetical protein L1987_20387 [Smallanthus sonchifolius]
MRNFLLISLAHDMHKGRKHELFTTYHCAQGFEKDSLIPFAWTGKSGICNGKSPKYHSNAMEMQTHCMTSSWPSTLSANLMG